MHWMQEAGELLWKYDPKVPKHWGPEGCCGVVNRGVAVKDGKVVVGTFDARLIALNAARGMLIWETQTGDIKKWPYTITGAPRIAKGKVFIGNGGAEYGVRGFVGAYDLETGAALWRFYTVPGNPADRFESEALAKAAASWNGKWWESGGGGNGTPWNRDQRSPGGGDNLYLDSIVALNPDTGDYIWHYQENPADHWDFTSTQQMIEPYTKTTWATHYDKNTWRPVETPPAFGEALLLAAKRWISVVWLG